MKLFVFEKNIINNQKKEKSCNEKATKKNMNT